ncbi:MAG TPA: hypothetical protein PLR20_00640 [Syntrophales bacterium]|nr:hypothetical protein [Syntrophales bacterium]HPI55880.1 hypothetical protein [Syntrophales bacterium]HPN23629.1 hypothetical protein [Syntrophales bacterium]HQM27846.1 hypothetical protein [Syntrophales bacterium]
MEKTEERLIAKYIQQDDELRKSVEDHRNFESALENFNKRLYLTPAEEMEKKKLQKLKLLSKDKIYQILSKYR